MTSILKRDQQRTVVSPSRHIVVVVSAKPADRLNPILNKPPPRRRNVRLSNLPAGKVSRDCQKKTGEFAGNSPVGISKSTTSRRSSKVGFRRESTLERKRIADHATRNPILSRLAGRRRRCVGRLWRRGGDRFHQGSRRGGGFQCRTVGRIGRYVRRTRVSCRATAAAVAEVPAKRVHETCRIASAEPATITATAATIRRESAHFVVPAAAAGPTAILGTT